MGVTFKLIKEIGTIGTTGKGEKKLQLVSWNHAEPTYDLRTWLSDGKATSGLTLSKEELLKIVELYKGNNTDDTKEVVQETKPKKTTTKKATEKKATEKKNTKKAAEKSTKSNETKEIKETESKTIDKPTGKKKIVAEKTNTSYTLDDCNKKLDELFQNVKDNADYAYVLTGIKELAVVDNDFVQNVMRESRTFEGMMSYSLGRCKEVGFMNGSCCVVDNDSMLALCLDYFNEKEKETEK